MAVRVIDEKASRKKDREQSPRPGRRRSSNWYYALIFLVIIFFGLIRFRLRDIPLERDEGEYAYAGQLMLQGIPPYQLAYNMKLPGTYAAYAVILKVMGQTPSAIHLGLLLVNAATTMLVFLLAARLFGRLAGLVAGSSYALLSASPSVLGFAGHATHFVVLPAVAGLLLLLKAIEGKRTWLFFCSGLLLGLAFVMKQPGFLFAAFGGLYLLNSERKEPVDWRGFATRAGVYSAGAIMPFAITCLILYRAGVFRNFWFWTFSYASQYGSIVPLADGYHLFWLTAPMVVGASIFVWIIAGLGLTAFLWDGRTRAQAVFVVGFFLFSFLAVCPGLYFRQHYFILMLPALSLLVGLAVSSATQRLGDGGRTRAWRSLPLVVFLIALVYSVNEQGEFLFQMGPVVACRSMYGANPFPEALKIAEYLRNHSSPAGRIAVLGSEPEIYFYAARHSATGYIYMYPLMEHQDYALQMQKEAASEIETARPEFVVYVNVKASWLAQPRSETFIFSWAQAYLQSQYELVGAVDIAQDTEYRWGDEVKGYQPRSQWTLQVYKKKA